MTPSATVPTVARMRPHAPLCPRNANLGSIRRSLPGMLPAKVAKLVRESVSPRQHDLAAGLTGAAGLHLEYRVSAACFPGGVRAGGGSDGCDGGGGWAAGRGRGK
jgi:hypothetical protein